MKNLVFYFQVHQPRRIRPYRRSEIGVKHDYFWDERNMEIMQRVAQKCYLPATRILLQEGIPASFSLSGVFLEQAAEYAPEVIDIFREYFRSGLGEIMSETYYHSLASIWNLETAMILSAALAPSISRFITSACGLKLPDLSRSVL